MHNFFPLFIFFIYTFFILTCLNCEMHINSSFLQIHFILFNTIPTTNLIMSICIISLFLT